jgi:hypothetical protein
MGCSSSAMTPPVETCTDADVRSDTRATEIVNWSYFEKQKIEMNRVSRMSISEEETTVVVPDFTMGKKELGWEDIPSINSESIPKENGTQLSLHEVGDFE